LPYEPAADVVEAAAPVQVPEEGLHGATRRPTRKVAALLGGKPSQH
jgi:hypothetical protein